MPKEPEANFEYENPQIKALLQDIGRQLKSVMPSGWGFSLMIFSFGPGGGMFYLSSAQRDDMLRAYREFLQKQGIEAGTDETAANIIGQLLYQTSLDRLIQDGKRPLTQGPEAAMTEAMTYMIRAKREHPESGKDFWDHLKREGHVT